LEYFANPGKLEILKVWIFKKYLEFGIFGIFGNSRKTGNCRIFYILGNLIFFKSWKIGNLKSLDFYKLFGTWNILVILENWKL